MTLEKRPLFVHIISHGPHCLDGVAAAVAVTRARVGAVVRPWFVTNKDVNDAVHQLTCTPADADHEVWITDVSWTDHAADRHLWALADRGVSIHWIDHHRTAIERYHAGDVDVPFATCIVSERFAASRLVYEHLRAEMEAAGTPNQRFLDLWPVIERADDTDRWIHGIPGSHELALAVRSMGSVNSYYDLLEIDRDVTYTPRMQAAAVRVQEELQRSYETAERERFSVRLPTGLTLVTTICQGYASEVAAAFGKTTPNAVFAIYDSQCLAVSLRRTSDCNVDLSRLARSFGGGGHPAAAGCELPWLEYDIPRRLAGILVPALSRYGG